MTSFCLRVKAFDGLLRDKQKVRATTVARHFECSLRKNTNMKRKKPKENLTSEL